MNQNEQKLREALQLARRELDACQAVLWQLEREGVSAEYGKGARDAIKKIKQALASEPELVDYAHTAVDREHHTERSVVELSAHISDAFPVVEPVAVSELERRVRAQAQLIKSMEATAACLHEQHRDYNEAIQTLASEREANRILTAEVEALKANPAEDDPVFWYRPRSDGGYEGPIHHSNIEDVRRQSGAWVPLFQKQLPAPLVRLTRQEIKSIAYRTIDSGRVSELQLNNLANTIMDAMIAKNKSSETKPAAGTT